MNRRFVRFDIDRVDAFHRVHRDAGIRKRAIDQSDQFRSAASARTAHPQCKRLPTIGQCLGAVGLHNDRAVFAERSGPVGTHRIDQRRQPSRLAGNPDFGPCEDCSGCGFHVPRIFEAPACGRVVQGHAQNGIARGRDGSFATQSVGNRDRDRIGAPMPSQKRHDCAAVVRNADDRRLTQLAAQNLRQRPDQDSCGADSDDSPSGLEMLPQLRADIGLS